MVVRHSVHSGSHVGELARDQRPEGAPRAATVVRRAVLAPASLSPPELVALQRALGNSAMTAVVGAPRSLQRNTITITEAPPKPLHLVLKVRGTRTRTGSPDPDPDPGGSTTVVGEDEGAGRRVGGEGPGRRVGGDSVIRFNGKDYYFEGMSVSRLTRLLDALSGTPTELSQIGAVSEARRHLRRRIALEGSPRQPPPVNPEGTKTERRQRRQREYAASRALNAAWAPFAGVHDDGGVARSTPALRRGFETATAALRAAIVGSSCLQERPALERRFAAVATLYRSTQLAHTGLTTPANRRAVTIADAFSAIGDRLDTKGLEGKNALKRELSALRRRHDVLQRDGLGILTLRDGFESLRADTQDLVARAWGLTQQKQKSDTTNWNNYYDRHDAHDQVVINATPNITVPDSYSAAITKGKNVIAAVQAGQPLVTAVKTHANSVAIIGKGTTVQFHIRLSQGSTQIRMEAFQTTRAVNDPNDSAPAKTLKFIDFKQIQFGH